MASVKNCRRFFEIGGGLVIASYLGKMLTFVCVAAVTPACLITESKNYQEAPSFPPSIVTPRAGVFQPLNQIIELVPAGGGEDGGVGELRFNVIVREPNVNDTVEVRVVVSRHDRMDSNIARATRISPNPTSTTPGERPFEFDLPTGTLSETGCNRIELIVASEFTRESTPADLAESARVVWWAGPAGADMTDCPQ